MKKPILKGTKGSPEKHIRTQIVNYLRLREWIIMLTHGNRYQKGFPDLYCIHPSYGQRWVEIKISHTRSKLTAAQNWAIF